MSEIIYRKPKRSRVFLQGADPWGRKTYSPGSTVRTGGCGLCSVTHMAIERSYYADYDPLDLIEFMKQYTEKGHGTLRSGITAGMKHIGLKDVRSYPGDLVGGDMKAFYEQMKKGDRVGCILFHNPTRNEGKVTAASDGTVWTKKGHYVAVLGLKKVDGYYWLYCKDSAGAHTGWYQYKKSMKGHIRMMWTGRVPEDPISLPAKGYFEKGDSSPEIVKIQKFLKKRNLYSGACKGNDRVLTDKAIRRYQEKYRLTVDGKFGGACLRQYVKLEEKK